MGLGPARPRPRRALRPVRARRRPAGGRRPRRPGLRPARQRVGPAAGAVTSNAGASSTTTWPSVWPSVRRGARRAPGRALRPLARWPGRRRLPPDRPAEAGPRGPHVAGARLDAAGLEEDARSRSSSRVVADPAVPNGIDRVDAVARPVGRGRRPCADPALGEGHDDPFRCRGDARAGARPARWPRAGSASRPSSCTAWMTASCPATASDVLRGRTAASSAGPTRACATSSTTSPKGQAIIDEVIAWLRATGDRRARRDAPIRCRCRVEGSGTHRLSRRRRGHRPWADGWRNVRQARSRTAPKPNRLAIAPTNGTMLIDLQDDQPDDGGEIRPCRSLARAVPIEQPLADPDRRPRGSRRTPRPARRRAGWRARAAHRRS